MVELLQQHISQDIPVTTGIASVQNLMRLMVRPLGGDVPLQPQGGDRCAGRAGLHVAVVIYCDVDLHEYIKHRTP